jgi:adenylate cyclase class 1
MVVKAARPIHLGVPGEEIDRRDLATVVRRFRNLHRLQMQRIQDCQAPRQRQFLDLLPLLFHCNHPNLPGYVTLDTPAGLPDYQPGRNALRAAARLSKSFEHRSRALPYYPVQALYLMGSVGSIAYSRKSDLDIWLCHAPELDAEALDELRRKAAGVEKWAASLGLEAHIFFIDPERFRAGQGTPISTESCGSVQHHLLLEEFYRTSLWLAGRIPGWWLVPPEQESHYAEYLRHLRDNRFVNPGELIDFGGLEAVRFDEFLGGALWHLHKAVEAPHKSLLKLTLMESYAAEYPQVEWLCTQVKAAVYEGTPDADALDSYLLMYRKVERYLEQRAERERLDLVRQCFYLKINGLLAAATASSSEKALRREVLGAMVREWQWPAQRIKDVDQRRRWRLSAALEEQKALARELNRSYLAVRRFALEHPGGAAPAGEELRLLGRRLSAALERRPGKVERLNLDSGDRIEAEDFALHEMRLTDGEPGWMLSTGRAKWAGADRPALKKARSLLEILAWLVLNGLHRPAMSPFLEAQGGALGPIELRQALDALAGFLKAQPKALDSLDAYARPARPCRAALFVNLGVDADPQRRDGLSLASSRYDALSYGYERVNLVARIDALVLTSWQEALVQQHQGLSGLLDCLADLANDAAGGAVDVACFCFAPSRARTLAGRVERLYRDLVGALGQSPGPARYVGRAGQGYFLFERQASGVAHRELADEERLFEALATPRPEFSPLLFDPCFVSGPDPLAEVYGRNRPGVVQVFCLPEPAQVRVFVLDERGALFYRVHEPLGPQTVLSPYAVFLGAVLQRYVLAASGVEYYLVERGLTGEYVARQVGFPPVPSGKALEVKVYAQEIAPGRAAYTICCDDWEFSSMEAGQDVFAAAREHILGLRRSGGRYPVHISDVDVPLSILGVDTPPQLQTVHLLQYKRKVEQRLNP